MKKTKGLGLVCVFAWVALAYVGSARAEGGKEVVGFPSPGAEAIYDALNVPETDVSQGLGISVLQKAVGGLVCQKSTVIVPGAISAYACLLGDTGRDDQAIYQALTAEEVDLVPPGIVGIADRAKSVGPLTCTMQYPIVPNPVPVYGCEIH